MRGAAVLVASPIQIAKGVDPAMVKGTNVRQQHLPTTRTAPAMLAQSLAVLDTIKSKLWDDAVPEQRKLTLQLARNTLYFTTAVFLIKQFGEQIAI